MIYKCTESSERCYEKGPGPDCPGCERALSDSEKAGAPAKNEPETIEAVAEALCTANLQAVALVVIDALASIRERGDKA